MKIYRLISTFIIITILCVGYVYQKVEIIQAGYNTQKNRRYLCYLVEKNSELMYELSKRESPRYLLASVDSKGMEFSSKRGREETTDSFLTASSHKPFENEGIFGRFMDIFTVSAEARTRD